MKGIRPAVLAFLFSVAILALGYAAFGIWTALIFTSGFMGGFLLWLLVHTTVPFAAIRVPDRLRSSCSTASRRCTVSSIAWRPLRAHQCRDRFRPCHPADPAVRWCLARRSALVKRGYAPATTWPDLRCMGITELAHFVLPLFGSAVMATSQHGQCSGSVPCAWWACTGFRSNGPTF